MLEDNPADADLCIRKLRSSGLRFEADVARSSREFMEYMGFQQYDVILADYRLPDWNGMDAFQWVRASGHDIPFILLTGTLGDELAIECIKAGMNDYILKENLDRLPMAIRRLLEERQLRRARDQAENELRESEKQYRLLFEANPHPMWVFDSQTLRFLTVNQAAIRHYGYSLDEFLSMTVQDICPTEDVDRFLESVDAQGRGESYAELWRHRKKDGTVIDVEVSSQPITLRAAPARLVLVHDVTVQRRIETQIRESREQLQLLLDSTAEAICALDRDGACTLCNRASLRLLGFAHESELLGKSIHALVHHTRSDGQPYPLHECKIRQSTQTGKRAHVTDEVFWRADGTSFPVEYWSHPIRREERIVGSVVTFFDISERKKSEEQLRRSELRYRSIIESAPYGIFRVDQDGRIVMANPAFATMLGYGTPQEVIGLNTRDIYSNPAEWQRARDYAWEDPAVGYETRWKRKDGQIIIVRLGGRILPEDNNELPRGFEVFVEDITERRSLQKQFEHAQKMEAVGRLAGGVAHDFNNLLMIISSYAQLMHDRKQDSEAVSQYIAQIRGAASRAAAITRQLLTFSRKQAVEPTILDLNHVVNDLSKMLPRLLREDVEMVLRLDAQLGRVRADRGQLEQVIMNLAVNAKDAMPKGGQLTIETANVTLDTAYHQRREISVPPGDYVLLGVTDTGVGMDQDTQRHIFEPFFTTKEEGKGTGLGLATVYAIVKQNRGFIWVYSEPARGSTFKIYLPRTDAAVAEAGAERLEAAPGGNETILLVEDETALRNVSRTYLESKGYTVLEASNAKDAMALCKNHPKPIHLLITDLVMPGPKPAGLELAKSARELRPEMAVVLVSGYADGAVDSDVAAMGAKFLQKPFSLDALARAIRSLLSKSRKILLIDDSQFMRVVAERALKIAGYTLKTASDGEQGLRLAREIRPDLVVLDLILPKVPGLEVLRRLREDPDTKDIPVIVLTALSEKNQERVLAEGAAAYLEKSEKLLADEGARLLATVEQVLAQESRSGNDSTTARPAAEEI